MSDLRDAADAIRAAAAGLGGTRPYDPLAILTTMARFGAGFDPVQVASLQAESMREWGDYVARLWTDPAAAAPRDRRFAAPAWQEVAWFRAIRDAYLLAGDQLRRLVAGGQGDAATRAMANVLLEGWLNAIAPSNFAFTNPQVIERTLATGGANLLNGFANLIEDVSAGKGIVRRRTDPDAFVKGETIAATPGAVVWQNDLCQLIQYAPATGSVVAEPLLYVPPLVNRYYMIDLQPKSSLVRWLVEQGRTVFVISWVNPGEAHRDRGVGDYVRSGIVDAVGEVRRRTGEAPALFAFCLGGTLAAIALGWLAAQGRGREVASATLIGAMVDFADMRDWAAFVHEAHVDAFDAHLDRQGYVDSVELQKLFSMMRANDLIWSAVVNHYLLDQPAPPSDLLYWFEDGARIPAAFLRSYNRDLLLENRLREPGGFAIDGVGIDLSRIETPLLSIALKEDHVSAWEAVYEGARLMGADFILGGSGHNAGVVNPPAAGRHGYWTGEAQGRAMPASAADWLAAATAHAGSWWPAWLAWLTAHGDERRVPARVPEAAIEPAPGSYAMMP